MSMSRKNYRDAAQTINNAVHAANALTPARKRASLLTCQDIASGLAFMFKSDNPRFRYDTFFEACGLDAYGKPIFS